MSNHVGRDRPASSSFAILVTLSLALMQLAPLTAASNSTGLPLQPTSDEQVCFSNVNLSLGQLPALSPATRTRFLQVAESSSQYKAFARAGGGVSLVSTLPAMESRISPDCSGVIIEAYTFSFVSGGKELSIAVDPSTMSVLRTLTVRAVNWGVYKNQTGGNWGGGYEYWNGTAGPKNPQYPYWYLEGVWNLPTVTSSCQSQLPCTYGIWSGLTDVANGSHLAQTGFGADTSTSGSTYLPVVPIRSCK